MLNWFLFDRERVERLEDDADEADGFKFVTFAFDKELLEPFVDDDVGPFDVDELLELFTNETEFKFGVGELDKTFFLIK